MNQTEAELLLLGLKNKQKKASAFSEIVRLYQERLYWHIRKMVLSHDDANDVLQNTFIKAWNGLEGFRGDSQTRKFQHGFTKLQPTKHLHFWLINGSGIILQWTMKKA